MSDELWMNSAFTRASACRSHRGCVRHLPPRCWETKNAIQVQLFCLVAATSVAILVAMSDMAAASAWGYQHPRRAEVNHRLARQNHRIDREFHEGEITRLQARQLHRKDHFVRREERFMASQHYGHITRAEQRSLNQQENGIGRQIGN
jgi:hypothetical protein